ncbi:MAG: branched-chain amino acid ABC transporter permease [Nocardioides sp.]|nr:branched-chain amino acid ABC transporter permease [Nocardioides sp.]
MAGVPQRLRTTWREVPLARHLVLAAIGLVLVAFTLPAVGDFRATQLTELAYIALAAAGLTVLTGLNGQLSLGHGALMAVGAYTTALLLDERDAGPPLVLVVLAAVAATLAVGVVVGVAAARLHGPYLAGATLAMAVAVPGIAVHFRDQLGGEQGLRTYTPEIPGWAADAAYYLTGSDPSRSTYVAFLAWATLLLGLVLLANLARSRTGRRWAAVRDDEVAAELAGIHLGRARVSAFAVSAAAAGAAGAMLAIADRNVAPGAFNLNLSMTLVAVVVLGGLGSLTGAIIGAAVLTLLVSFGPGLGRSLGLDDLASEQVAPLVAGLVTVAVILLAPRGLAGIAQGRLAARRARRAYTSAPSSDGGSPPSSSTPAGSGSAGTSTAVSTPTGKGTP